MQGKKKMKRVFKKGKFFRNAFPPPPVSPLQVGCDGPAHCIKQFKWLIASGAVQELTLPVLPSGQTFPLQMSQRKLFLWELYR